MSKNIKTKLAFISLILIFITTSAFGCRDTVSKEEAEKIKPIELEIWRAWDGQDKFADIISAYEAIHSNIRINYKKLRYEEYERELLEAFAEGKGPDIFSINSGWLKRYESKISPMPSEITLAYTTTEQGAFGGQEQTVELKKTKSLVPKDIKKQFAEIVYNQAIIDDEIYGLPLSLDTLVLFYNRDLLNNENIVEPPQYWNQEFLEDVAALTKQNSNGDIVQSGVAIGSAFNIDRYSDILSLLMMQNGAEMLDVNGNVFFHKMPTNWDKPSVPGIEALRFYTDFANPIKEVYAWNKDMPNSLNAFTEGRLGMFFGYSYHIPMIKATAPRLNFGISKMLQIEGNEKEINMANFWLETVSKQSELTAEAWDFIQFATRAENVQSYLTKTSKPSALRAIIEEQKESEDEYLSVFVDQILTSKIWYQGKDYNAAEVIMGEMIEQALLVDEPDELRKIVGIAANKIQQTIY